MMTLHDHFKPKSLEPDLMNTYSNLVYSCPFCNNAKGNYWPSFSFPDPSSKAYAELFFRDSKGAIYPQGETADQIYRQLKLYLGRHSIRWKLQQIYNRLKAIKTELEKNSDVRQTELEEMADNLRKEFLKYWTLLQEE